MPTIENPIFHKYKLECTYIESNGVKCNGKLLLEQAASAGLQLGDVVPEDPGNHNYARCPRCRRCRMKVVSVPSFQKPDQPTGFTKIPTE